MNRCRGILLAHLLAACSICVARADIGNRGAWGDRGDGTYLNPILPGDYSDIDAIRVDDDYYAISSTLHLSPGMAVLHSRDLVNWTIISHAVEDVTQIGPEMNWDRMNRYGRGVWAGAIRYHDGKYWIYFGAPDEGIFMTTAEDPAGPWAPLHQVWATSGWNDTCPFWDDDGQGYLATTRFAEDSGTGVRYNIHLFEMSDDGRSLRRSTDRVLYQSRGSEASKLYKIKGRYYHYFSEVTGEGRVPMMRRARRLDGTWETRQIGHVDRQVDREPNQGGLIELPSGAWWFLTHQGTGAWEGRTMCLLPVTWIDGWPIIGKVGENGIGDMVWKAVKPIQGMPSILPPTDDDFRSPELGEQWEWNHQPRSDKWSLTERPGYLRLHAFPPLKADDLMLAGNTLSQRAMAALDNEVSLEVDIGGMADGQVAGLCHFASTYGWLGVRQENGRRTLVFNNNGSATEGPKIEVDRLWLRSTWDQDGVSHFSYSVDGETFAGFGETYQLTWGHYRGDRVGAFTYNNRGEVGFLDVDAFRYEFSRSTSTACQPALRRFSCLSFAILSCYCIC